MRGTKSDGSDCGRKEMAVTGESGGAGGDADFKAFTWDGRIALNGADIPMRLEDLREEAAAVGVAESAALEEIRVDETRMEGSEELSGNYGGEKKKKTKRVGRRGKISDGSNCGRRGSKIPLSGP